MKTITNSMMTKTAEQPQTISATTRNTSLTIGIDLGDQWSQFCLLDANGTVCEEGVLSPNPGNVPTPSRSIGYSKHAWAKMASKSIGWWLSRNR
jgi:activator of 2-hydroxyglutaryl-CoA dehydratase